MEKRTFQDVVPPTERTVRRIPIAGRPATIRTTAPIAKSPTPKQAPPPVKHFAPLTERPTKDRKKLIIGSVIAAVIIIGVAVISVFFARAYVRITTKHTTVKIDNTFTAMTSGSTPGLRYTVATSTTIASEVVPATKGTVIQTKARGKVTIINTSSTVPQKLITQTRLESTDGTVYRLDHTITVPAVTTVAGKIVPASIIADITADQYGDTYNLSLKDGPFVFTFPGFKGSKKYDMFSARASTNITGGYLGMKNIISPTVASQAEVRIQKKLTDSLLANIRASVASSTYILYDTGYTVEYQRLADISKGSTNAEIRYSGTIYVPVFEQSNLIASIARADVEKLGGPENLSAEGLQGLIFTSTALKTTSFKKNDPLTFSLRGTVKLTGIVNIGDVQEHLQGLAIKDSNAIFAKYLSIASAEVSTVPQWIRTFPTSPERIEITVVGE